MPLRSIECTIPALQRDRVPALLAGAPIVQAWTTSLDGDLACVRILVDARHSESLSDLLVKSFGASDGFRLVSFTVEATIPAVPDEEPAKDAASDDSKAFKIGPQRISREELYEDIAQASKVNSTYVVTVVISTLVAAVGLIRGDVAIVIGAMVIAPLLGPNVALSLAAALGDLALAQRSFRAIGVGIGTVALLSLSIGFVLQVEPDIPEIVSRTRVGLADIVLALAAGTAGSLAFTSGVPAVVVGVMVAVALLPPLVVAGLLGGAGHGSLALGALVLVTTNVACVNLAAVATFFIQKVRPRDWWELERARKATIVAAVLWLLMLALIVVVILYSRSRE